MLSLLRHRPKHRPSPDAIDLYLGADVVWVLKLVEPRQVRRVIAYGGSALAAAEQLGIETLKGDCNRLDFSPSAVALSVHYPVRIRAAALSKYRVIYNLHPGYLPWCRGLSSASWALWEGSPAGATLHEMTEELDAGPIVDRIEVEYGPDELCGEVQNRVGDAERKLFQSYWQRIAAGERLPAVPQGEAGSSHTHAQTARFLRRVRREGHWRTMSSGDLIKLLRSFGGLELEHGGRVLHLHIAAARSQSKKGD